MDVRNCKKCGTLYNYIGGSYKNLCPRCIRELEDKFEEVKNYIRDNPNATIAVVSEECDVQPEQIQRWVREERLIFSKDSPIGIPCESCGTTIKSGRFCDKCRTEMGNQFASAIEKPKVEFKKQARNTTAKMRFLDN